MNEIVRRTSDKPPLKGRRAVDARAYPEPIQTQFSPCKSLAIVGKAVEIPVRSNAERKSEMETEMKISQNLLSRCGFPEGAVDGSDMVVC